MKHVGTRVECEAALEAWAFAAGYPFPPTGMPPAVSAPLRAQWAAATPAQRIANGWIDPETDNGRGPFLGWSLRPAAIEAEVGETDLARRRFYLEMPEEILTIVVPDCVKVHNRTLGAARTTTLTTARARCTDELPADWKTKAALTAETRR